MFDPYSDILYKGETYRIPTMYDEPPPSNGEVWVFARIDEETGEAVFSRFGVERRYPVTSYPKTKDIKKK